MSSTKLFRYPSGLNSKALDIEQSNSLKVGSIITFGNFDGLHRGHLDLLRKLVKDSKELKVSSVLLSLYPHPRQVITGIKTPNIESLVQKLSILSDIGLDLYYLLHFTTEVQNLSPEDFLTKVVLEKLNPIKVIVGPDAAVGKNRAGDLDYIQRFFKERNIAFEVFPFTLNAEEQKVSSTELRSAILSGNIDLANKLLGRNYCILDKVIPGDKRGRTLGFPTANILPKNQLLPSNGVYATRTSVAGEIYKSITNIGTRPTFYSKDSETKTLLESHLLNYQGPDFYRQKVKVEFLKRLRGEKKFSSLEDLKKQIALDIASLD